MNFLHSDILKCIFAFFNDATQTTARFTCRRWHTLIHRPKFNPRLDDFFSSLTLMEWAISRGCPLNNNAYYCACYEGRIDILNWLQRKNVVIPNDICDYCTSDLSLLQWAQYNGSQITPNTLKFAVMRGHHDILPWLYLGRGIELEASYFLCAAAGGHLKVLQWLHANGCPHHERTCEVAVKNRHYEVLRWAYDNGCPWSTSVCTELAEHGQLDLLKWVRFEGCPWNDIVYLQAITFEHENIMEWAYENNCPRSPRLYETAIYQNDFKVLKWLRARDFPFNREECMIKARMYGSREIQDWVVSSLN